MLPHSVFCSTVRARPTALGVGLVRAQRLAAFVALSLFVLGNAVPGDAIAGSIKARQKKARRESGLASYYGPEFNHRRTASGERFDPKGLTAAHRTLPFGTRVRVTNLENGRRVVVRINDRGPFRKGRVLDLSPAAARRLGFTAQGIARVRLDVLGRLAASRGSGVAGDAGAPRARRAVAATSS
jgi:rare lipoprotein A (peptidoglycan hydrolase)